MPVDRTDERLDDPVGTTVEQFQDRVLDREEDGCEACGADVEVVYEDFDATHRYTVRCLSRTPCDPRGWQP